MNKHVIITVVLSICVLLSNGTQAKPKDNSNTPTISVTKLDINDEILRLNYEIRNNSDQDVWICENISQTRNFEMFLDEDGQTLVIRKRLDVPTSIRWLRRPTGKYVLLGPGKELTESLLLNVPVNPINVYTSRKYSQSFTKATQLSIEIGYYIGNLPQMYLDMLQGHENPTDDRSKIENVRLGVAAGFNRMNESLRQRDDEVRIPYTYQEFKGEKVLGTTIGNLSMPYVETSIKPKYTLPDLTNCNRLEIQYEPSILEYYYPYESEQHLLSKEEVDFLQSRKKIVIENTKSFSDFAKELEEIKTNVGGIVSEKNKANVVGYHNNRQVTSFIIYDDITIETEKEQRINYFSELQSFRTLTQSVQPFELRRRCAADLKILWYRLRFYDQTEKSRMKSIDMDTVFGEAQTNIVFEHEYTKIDFVYPAPRTWCGALELNYGWPTSESYFSQMKAHVCPGVGEGQSTYAINPNCKYDSPHNTVLLFETKDGWNQHGGPELFTFDNHDPKGGCVLLNDGTVKFIRTTEELRQLRWK